MQDRAQNGYTGDEVEDELRYSRGFRELSFRYELLDFQNNYIRDLDTVIDANIKQDYTADIKRTATFTILDDKKINYLNQRIKPWVRLKMPGDARTYKDVIDQYLSGLTAHYRLDETSGTSAANYASPGQYTGTVGASVGLGLAGITGGSSMNFTGLTTSAGRITVTGGYNLIYTPSGATVPQVKNIWSHSIWMIPSVVVSATIWQNSTGTVSLKFDASGNVVFTAASLNGATQKVSTVPNPFGKDLRNIIVAWRLGAPAVIYLNGIAPEGGFFSGEFNAPLDSGTADLWIGHGFTGKLDAVSFMTNYITYDKAFEIYRAGVRTGPFGAINYAEWPQGVFLLSSPDRDLDEAGAVTRQIAGYDQAEVLTDNLIQKRYVAQAASLYMNNILGLILSYQPIDLSAYSSAWRKVNTNTPHLAGSSAGMDGVTITGPTSAGANGAYTDFTYTVANLDFQFIATPPGAVGNGTRSVRYRFFIDSNNYSEIVAVRTGAGAATLTANQKINGSVVATANRTWDAVTTIWGRITEYNGYTIFQTYNNTTNKWSTLLTTASDSYLKNGRISIEAVATGAEPAWTASEGTSTSAAVWQHVNAHPSSAFLPHSKDYDMGVSRLSIVNDLLDSIAYDHLFFDFDGKAVLRPYVSPAVRPARFTYADDHEGVTFPGNMRQTLDLFKIPNVWVASSTSPDGTSFSNINYPKVNRNPNSPTSTVNRKRTITKVMTNVPEAPDLPTLLAWVDKVAEQDSQVFEIITFETAIIPIHGDRDVLQLENKDLGISDKYEQVGWSFQMKDGARMQHQARKHVDIS